jgi:hypothetical protein
VENTIAEAAVEEWEDQHELHQIILHSVETEFITTTEWVLAVAVDQVTGQIVITLLVETMVVDMVQVEAEIVETLARKVVHHTAAEEAVAVAGGLLVVMVAIEQMVVRAPVAVLE